MSKTFTNKEVFGKLHEEGNSEGAKKGWETRGRGASGKGAASSFDIHHYNFPRGSKARKEAAHYAKMYRRRGMPNSEVRGKIATELSHHTLYAPVQTPKGMTNFTYINRKGKWSAKTGRSRGK
jgi:hypothetical protein